MHTSKYWESEAKYLGKKSVLNSPSKTHFSSHWSVSPISTASSYSSDCGVKANNSIFLMQVMVFILVYMLLHQWRVISWHDHCANNRFSLLGFRGFRVCFVGSVYIFFLLFWFFGFFFFIATIFLGGFDWSDARLQGRFQCENITFWVLGLGLGLESFGGWWRWRRILILRKERLAIIMLMMKPTLTPILSRTL